MSGTRCTRARGDERLSGRQQRESDGIGKSKSSSKGASKAGGAAKIVPRDKGRDKGARKQRAADLGRALRSVYDDTLRESVPDDFHDLLGKLT
jgi:hypothetical protein